MSALGEPAVLARAAPVVAFDPSLPPRLTVEPGARVRVETHDARAGALLDREPGRSFELGRPDPATSNGLTGPIAVRGARPGDRLVVEVEELRQVKHRYVQMRTRYYGRTGRPITVNAAGETIGGAQ